MLWLCSNIYRVLVFHFLKALSFLHHLILSLFASDLHLNMAPHRKSACQLLLPLLASFTMVASKNVAVVVGFLGSDPMQVMSMDSTTGQLTLVAEYDAGPGTAWMVASPDLKHLYVANHGQYPGPISPGTGGVTHFWMDWNGTASSAAAGISLRFDASVPMYNGANPVHIALKDSFVFSVSYGTPTYFNYAVDSKNGSLSFIVAEASGGCRNAHQIVLAPSKRYSAPSYAVIVPCLGSDFILNDIAGQDVGCAAGHVCGGFAGPAMSRNASGPRHVVLHPYLNLVYALNELDSSISTWDYDIDNGVMLNPRYISSLPPDAFTPNNKSYWAGAEIAISSDARFLYVSNRALPPCNTNAPSCNSSIGVFALDTATGAINSNAVQFARDGVVFPRHFSISPDGQFLLCANQKGASVTVFKINTADGTLAKVGTFATNAQPAFVMALPDPPSPGPASGAVRSVADSASLIAAAALLISVVMAATMGAQ